MPDEPRDEEIVETKTGELPAATPAPPEGAIARFELDEMSDEELLRRQAAISPERRPAGPPLEEPASRFDSEPADVPETDVSDAVTLDTD